MELSWLQSLVYGLLSGLTEFFPVSADVHRQLYRTFLGRPSEESGLLFSVRLGCFLAVFFSCLQMIRKMYRERRIAAIPKRRRKRAPDPQIIAGIRLFRTAVIPLLLSLFAYRYLSGLLNRLWLLVLVLVANGLVLYLPQRFPSANKDGLSLTPWDALLMGFAGAAAVMPGLSRVGMITSAGLLRGGDRRYVLDLCLLLCVPILFVVTVLDGIPFFTAAESLNFATMLRYFCTAAAAFGGAYLSIFVMRFLSFKVGFSGFAYYSWGAALFIFILYLTI